MCRKCVNKKNPYNKPYNKLQPKITVQDIQTLDKTRPMDYKCKKRDANCCHNLFGHQPSVDRGKQCPHKHRTHSIPCCQHPLPHHHVCPCHN